MVPLAIVTTNHRKSADVIVVTRNEPISTCRSDNRRTHRIYEGQNMKEFFMPSGIFHREIALSKQKQSKEEEKKKVHTQKKATNGIDSSSNE